MYTMALSEETATLSPPFFTRKTVTFYFSVLFFFIIMIVICQQDRDLKNFTIDCWLVFKLKITMKFWKNEALGKALVDSVWLPVRLSSLGHPHILASSDLSLD